VLALILKIHHRLWLLLCIEVHLHRRRLEQTVNHLRHRQLLLNNQQ
jgi:hypothetical protein